VPGRFKVLSAVAGTRILMISGSLRARSTNSALLDTVAELGLPGIVATRYRGSRRCRTSIPTTTTNHSIRPSPSYVDRFTAPTRCSSPCQSTRARSRVRSRTRWIG
jgi:hypothetical protein